MTDELIKGQPKRLGPELVDLRLVRISFHMPLKIASSPVNETRPVEKALGEKERADICPKIVAVTKLALQSNRPVEAGP